MKDSNFWASITHRHKVNLEDGAVFRLRNLGLRLKVKLNVGHLGPDLYFFEIKIRL